MRNRKTCIYNANIVLPEKVIPGYILIDGNKIAEIGEIGFGRFSSHPYVTSVNAHGRYIMPGMIDMHCDAIEKEIQPRPNTLLPIEMGFYELEKKLAASGITTMYHSLTLSDEWGVRDKDMVLAIIKSINKFKKTRAMINHKIHLRYELTFLYGLSILEDLIVSKSIDFMSYMDHTPGQGQFKDEQSLKNFTVQSYGREEREIEAFMEKTKGYHTLIDWSKLIALAKMAKTNGVSLASHDDDTEEKIETLLACGGSISEFPVNLKTALYAKSKGLHVCVGAPNIVRGRSHSDNMRAIDAIKSNAADILCSDYVPGAMLPAIFQLTGEGIKLTEAVKLASTNPAKVLGIDRTAGSIEVGKNADLIIVELHQDYPIVRQTIVSGTMVFQSDFQSLNTKRVDYVC